MLLTDYKREIDQLGFQEGRWAGSAPLLSAKIALVLHVCSTEAGREISSSSMRHAIGLARRLVEQSAAAARACVAGEKSKTVIGEAARMFEKLQRVEPATPRTLFRMYDNPSKSLRQPVLDHLVRTGQVQVRSDGMLESLPQHSLGNK